MASIRKLLAATRKMKLGCSIISPIQLSTLRRIERQTIFEIADSAGVSSMQKRNDPLGWISEKDREQFDFKQLSEEQLKAIQQDTRLPGEIGFTYGVSAATILYIQRHLARRQR
jgi:hypothetical protein